MAKFYGDCLVIPEANNDAGLILFLRRLHVRVWEREKPATDKEDQKPMGKLGVWTSDDGMGQGTRSAFLGELRSAVRKHAMDGEGLDIPFLHIIDEMEHFAVNTNTGRAEALDKWHDDFVLALSFAYFLRHRGTVLVAPALNQLLPPDVRAMLAQEKRERSGIAHGAHRI